MATTIFNGILIALGPLLLWLLKWGLSKLTGVLADYAEKKTSNETLVTFIKRVDDAAMRVVKSVYMTYVDAIKTKEGRALTEEEKQRAKNLALDKLKSYLGASGLDELATIFGYTQAERDKYLDEHIEAAVYDAKHGPRSGIGNGSINLGEPFPQQATANG
jgi:hypothetical protein